MTIYKTVNAKRFLKVLSLSPLLIANAAYSNEIVILPYSVGEFEVAARLDVSLGYGNNVFRGSSVEDGLTYLNIVPTVEAINENALRRITLNYEGELATFFQGNRDDDYISTQIGAEYIAKLGLNHELGFGFSFEDGNNIRGTDILEGSNSEVDGPSEFEDTSLSIDYLIGSDKRGPSLELGYEYNDLDFTNFAVFNEGRDRVSNILTARLGYQYSVATQFFIDLGYSDFNYDGEINNFNGSLDGSEKRIEVGVKWRATRQTSGEFSIGITDKEFDDFNDPSSLTSWNANVEWKPSKRDVITFSSFSRPTEQTGTGLFIDVEQYAIDWDHQISRRWDFNANFTTGSADFEDTLRRDDYDVYTLGASFQPTKFSLISFEYIREEKDSSSSSFDFDTDTVLITYSTSL